MVCESMGQCTQGCNHFKFITKNGPIKHDQNSHIQYVDENDGKMSDVFLQQNAVDGQIATANIYV